MSQGGYQAYPAYEPGAPYFNGSLEGPPRSFDARTGAQQSAIKQLEPGLQAILDAPHDARHSISSRPFDTYTYPGYEASFHATSSSVDQNLQVLLSGHRPYASSRETSVAYSNPIANFYNDADGPWNSLRAASQARSSASTATVPVLVPNLDYTSYRDAPASEISDSGYASQAAASQSIVNTEPTDYNRECGDLPVQVNSFSFTAASSSSPPYNIRPLPNRNADEADTTSASRSKTGQTSLLCTICGDTARCPSDYKKHRLKHTKPWKCEEPHCSRKDGFTTINDLTRHKKSVHKIGGMTKSFRCVDERCKNKDKLWPRLDNFKQHVTRMHGDRNMEDLIRRSQTFGNLGTAMLGTSRAEPVSQMDCTLAGIDSKSSDLDIAQSNNSPDMALTQDRNEENFDGLAPGLKASFSSAYSEPHVWNQPQLQAYQEEAVSFPQTAEDQKQGRKPQPDAPKLRELADAATAASGPSENPSAQNGLNAGLSKGQPPKQLSIQEDSQRGFLAEFSNRIAMSIASGSATESLEKAVLRAILELKDNNNILTATNDHSPPGSKANGSYKSPGRPPPGSSGPDGAELTITTEEVREGLAILSKGIKNSARKSNLMANSKTKRTQYLKCPKCSKLFSRQCDLNKHMKRHDRPYGCTFSKCYKGFGSKNDWKRHEGSQHFHYDMWRCEQLRHATSISSSPLSSTKNPSGTKSAVCKEVFWTGMDFSNHLRDTHCFDIQSITTELRVRLLERGCGLRFWCGFCEAVIPLKRKGSRAADERFNHIDEHFKKGLRTTAWLDVETNKYKGDMELEETKEKNENDSAQDSGEEGSLGEGGNDEGKEDDQGPIMRAAEKAEADVVILTAPRKTGQKRAREESEGEEEAAMGQPRKRRKEETLFFCCGCKQGPFAWSLYQSCLHCEHEFCEHCDRRKHESSAEESVDYNLWNHVTGLGS